MSGAPGSARPSERENGHRPSCRQALCVHIGSSSHLFSQHRWCNTLSKHSLYQSTVASDPRCSSS
eukprot:8450430-Pyramimonas_sp.AAC.1